MLRYKLTAKVETDNPSLKPLLTFIDGRFPPDERMTMVAMPAGAPETKRTAAAERDCRLFISLIPADFRDMTPDRGHAYSYGWENMGGGLDGIAIDLPALKVKPTHGEYVPMNIQIKDPLWPMRDMLDFSFSVKPGEPHTLVARHSRPHSAEWQESLHHDCVGECGVWSGCAGRRGAAADLQAVEGRG